MDVMDSNMLYLLVYVIFGFGICIYIKKKVCYDKCFSDNIINNNFM